MHAGLLRDVLTLAVGVVTGVLSAAFGVGGAVVSTPADSLVNPRWSITSASSGGLPVRSPNPKSEPFAAAHP